MSAIYRIAKRVNYPVSIPVKDNTRAKTVVVSMHFRLIPPRAPLPPSPPPPWVSFQPSGPWPVSSGTISRRVRSSPVKGVNLSACPACGAFRPARCPATAQPFGLWRVPSTFAACSPPVVFAPVRPARCPFRRAARLVPLAVCPVPCRMSGATSSGATVRTISRRVCPACHL